MNQEEIDKLTADLKQIHKDAEHIGNPLDLYDPSKKVRTLTKEEKEERDKQRRKDDPNPYTPPPAPYHVTTDKYGVEVWEQRYATEEQLAAKRAEYGETQPVIKHKFTAVVDSDRRQWAVRQNNITRFFSSSDDVAIFCRKASRGEHGQVEFYTARRPLNEWLGEELGDYITTESW